MATEAPLRLGIVRYLAGRPCVEGLDADPRFSVTRDEPAVLVELLRKGEIDCALVSSIEAFRRPGYRYVPGIAIAAERRVRSVLIIGLEKIENCKSIALDPASRTGAALARICIHANGGGNVKFHDVPFGSELALAGTDAWVRIGDAALVEAARMRETPDGGLYIYDLAEMWRGITNLPFVFALWLVRPGVAWRGEYTDALTAARDRGIAASERLAAEYSNSLAIPADSLLEYLTESCCYDLTRAGMLESLLEFQRRAAALGLADGGLPLVSV
ncbi:MAG: menaquinone biosynthesis protein [Planctomycetes bacterium]|nr:menaquinone biosynthesis protein [Planctomycetota bacterium]